MRAPVFALLLPCLALGVALAQTNSASLSGAVAGDDGKPLPAMVTVIRNGRPPAGGRAQADPTGAFAIHHLPPGTYTVCAHVKGRGYMDPCSWEPDHQVQLSAGQSLAGYRLILKHGALLQVRLNDAAGLLSAAAVPGKPAPHVLLGVMTAKHLLEPLDLTATDSTGRSHEGTIPLNRASSLYIVGRGIQIADSAGSPLNPAGATVPVNPGPNNQPVALTFSIH